MQLSRTAALPRKARPWSVERVLRDGLYWFRLIEEAIVEAQEMRRVAHARYPFMEF